MDGTKFNCGEMMEKHNLDKLFKSKLAHHQYPYEAGSWSAMESAINSGAGKSGLWWALGLGGAVTVPLALLLNFNLSTTAAVSLDSPRDVGTEFVVERVALTHAPKTFVANELIASNSEMGNKYSENTAGIPSSNFSEAPSPASGKSGGQSGGTYSALESTEPTKQHDRTAASSGQGSIVATTTEESKVIHNEALASVDNSIIFTSSSESRLLAPSIMAKQKLEGFDAESAIQGTKESISQPIPLMPPINFSQALSINGGVLIPNRQLTTSNAALAEYVAVRQKSELPVPSFTTGIGYTRSLGQLELTTGINYLTIQEKVKYDPVTTTSTSTVDSSYWDVSSYTEMVIDSVFNPANGAGFWTYDTIMVTTIDSSYVEQYIETSETQTRRFDVNQITKFNYVEIPVSIGKVWTVGRQYLGSNQFIVGAHAGIGVGILTSTTGAYINTGMDDIQLHVIRKNHLMANLQARVIVGYRITTGFPMSIQLEPNIRQTLGNIGSVTGVKQNYTLFGLNLTLVKYIGG